eukprot:NODE_311_length_10039_cov_0.864487.p7 type:complete len:188 gc:universal NODE_311_length_10039_cov_0.864487:9011-8448(-)
MIVIFIVLAKLPYLNIQKLNEREFKVTNITKNQLNENQVIKETCIPSEMINDIKMEFEMLQSLDHSNIINLISYNIIERDNYLEFPIFTKFTIANRKVTYSCVNIILPYYPMNLREYALEIKENQSKFRKLIRNAAKQLLKAVRYLNKQGIAHRDIKPENVMIFIWQQGKKKVKQFRVHYIICHQKC